MFAQRGIGTVDATRASDDLWRTPDVALQTVDRTQEESNTMKIHRYTLAAAVLVGATTFGCGSSQDRQSVPAMYGAKLSAEQEAERREFIAEKQEDLREIENEINRMQVRIEHESEYVDADKRADWSNELFELKQERQDIQARLSRAQNATPEEWNEMRGFLGGSIDRLQAGVGALGGQIEQMAGGERAPVRGEEEEMQETELEDYPEEP
jgi:hypothetical protein